MRKIVAPPRTGSYVRVSATAPSLFAAYLPFSCTVNPVRDVKVGTMSKLNTAISNIAPDFVDRIAKSYMGKQQRNELPLGFQGSPAALGASETLSLQTI